MDDARALNLTVFTSGACVMVIEVLGFRLAAPYFGSSTYVLSALMGVILGSLSVGYYSGGRKADLKASRRMLSRMLFAAGFFVLLIPLLSPSCAHLSRKLGYRLGPIVFGVFLFTVPNFFLGMVPPYAIKLAARSLEKVGSVSGDLYALSTVGSIAGTFLSGFVLIPLFPMKAIFFGVMLSLFLVGFFVSGSKEALFFSLIFVLLFWAAFAASAGVAKDSASTVVYEEYTPYQRILVVDESGRNIRSMMLDSSIAGGIRLYDNLSAYPYASFFELPFLMDRGITSVCMFGEGTGIGAMQLRRAHPETKIVVYEIDPRVHDVAVRYFNAAEDENLKFAFGDGRMLLQDINNSYDLVILDAFNSPYYIPAHLTTLEFYREIAGHLNPGGILELNVISSLDENESIFMQSLCRTIGREFKYVYFYAVQSPADRTNLQNVIILASKKPLAAPDGKDLQEYQNALFGETQLADMLGKRVEEFDCSKGILLTDDYSPADYLMEAMAEKHS
jgi:spermidine synthase